MLLGREANNKQQPAHNGDEEGQSSFSVFQSTLLNERAQSWLDHLDFVFIGLSLLPFELTRLFSAIFDLLCLH